MVNKAKTYGIFTKDKGKEMSAEHYGKSSGHKGRKYWKEGTKELQNDQRTISKMTAGKFIPTNNYLKCKWTEFSNQKTQSGLMDNTIKPNKSQVPAAYKRLTSAFQTHID